MSTNTAVRLVVRGLLALSGVSFLGLAGGCTALVTPGETMASHAKGHPEDPGTAPSDGEYVLMHKFIDATPLETAALSRGDRLGFATAQTGQIIAVAGDDEWVYTDNDYIWVRRKR